MHTCVGREEELPMHIQNMATQCRQHESEVQHLQLEMEASLQHLCSGLKQCVNVLVFLMQNFKLNQHAVSSQHPFNANLATR